MLPRHTSQLPAHLWWRLFIPTVFTILHRLNLLQQTFFPMIRTNKTTAVTRGRYKRVVLGSSR